MFLQRFFYPALPLLLFAGSCQQLWSQTVGLDLDTELQVTPSGRANFLSLLYLNANCPMGRHLQWNAATISIVHTRRKSLVDDLQGFSNIEAGNQPLAPALFGLQYSFGEHHTLHAGVRNVNEDYFTSPVTSLFTDSSCGIFPTLGSNFDIANYPLASMGIHYAYATQSFGFQASAYNGRGYDRWAGHDNVWRVTPGRDGLFAIAQADLTHGNSHYFLGSCLHTGPHSERTATSAVWGYTEQTLGKHLALIIDYSHAFGRTTSCTDFAGLGAQWTAGQSVVGLFTDYARFRDDWEWATELTYKYELNAMVSLQTSFHLIDHDSWQPVGLFRVSISL